MAALLGATAVVIDRGINSQDQRLDVVTRRGSSRAEQQHIKHVEQTREVNIPGIR